MIIDTSAVLAILLDEQDAARYADAIAGADQLWRLLCLCPGQDRKPAVALQG